MLQSGSDAVQAYYRAAVVGLRALEQREGRARRFGPEADTRWARFRGKLNDGDRLLVLLRDASAPWGIAFAASRIFRLPGVAGDEPFGSAWVPPTAAEAQQYLAESHPTTVDACAGLLRVPPPPVDVPDLRPGTRLAVAGASAVLALARAFIGRADLDWALQVTVVADAPAPRQLAGLASVFVGAVRPCTVLSTDRPRDPVAGLRVISSDAEPACAGALG